MKVLKYQKAGAVEVIEATNHEMIDDEMTTAQFDQMMATGLKQAKEDDSFDVDEGFAELEG